MQKIQKMFCPNCGAPITFQEGREDTFCMHCGTQCFREDSQLDRKLTHEERMQDRELTSKDRENRLAVIGMIAILFIGLLMVIATSGILFAIK